MRRAFDGLAALLFAGSAAATVAWSASMADMPGMEMPGGWLMSMTWMRMPGQSWAGAAASFVGMWALMMTAMMLPAIVPALREYRLAMAARATAAYLGVWISLGVVIYPLGLALAELEMRVPAVSRAVPMLAAIALLGAGLSQLSAWKMRQLECCRAAPAAAATPAAAWKHGQSLGLRCCACCAPLTAALLVVGVMNPAALAAGAAAIALERRAERGRAVARLSGALLLGAGLLALARV
jgi:predicted metal-binding membrane protein